MLMILPTPLGRVCCTNCIRCLTLIVLRLDHLLVLTLVDIANTILVAKRVLTVIQLTASWHHLSVVDHAWMAHLRLIVIDVRDVAGKRLTWSAMLL